MTAETLALIASYFLCSVAAEERLLTGSEVEICMARYMEVKLNFVDDVDEAEYYSLSATERAAVNMKGYDGYVNWRTENPALVEQMMGDAKQQLEQQAGL